MVPARPTLQDKGNSKAVNSTLPPVEAISASQPRSNGQANVNDFAPDVSLVTGAFERVALGATQDSLAVSMPASGRSALLKHEASDTKSSASRSTAQFDEKESLRPDDSQSMQAATEEDTLSPEDSVHVGSRKGSEPDVRAFRDQLHVIDKTANSRIPEQPAALALPNEAGKLIIAESTSSGHAAPVTYRIPVAPISDALPSGPPSGVIIDPDDKLLEALASPKDRLFVLKIEQDLIDFLRDSRSVFLYQSLQHRDLIVIVGRQTFNYRKLTRSIVCFLINSLSIIFSGTSMMRWHKQYAYTGSHIAGFLDPYRIFHQLHNIARHQLLRERAR